MQSILIVNPKGGSGKTTLATNLAGFFAWRGDRVILGDMDRQQSSLHWLSIRSPHLPRIEAWDARDGDLTKAPATDFLILDAPAGIHGKTLANALKAADKVLVPVPPSLFDIWAVADFFQDLKEHKAVRKHAVHIGVVGMRVDPRTRAAATLQHFFEKYELPVIGWLRDTQVYVQAAALGETLFDLPRAQSERELEQWLPLVDWVRR
ncbi:ParA family protein [Thiobacter aerophilum]|uniref:ParA family protein n=1 Tax=Thiobacter aerophilum TaxID=3121275 RepID=A0ABV0EGF8_9BURK